MEPIASFEQIPTLGRDEYAECIAAAISYRDRTLGNEVLHHWLQESIDILGQDKRRTMKVFDVDVGASNSNSCATFTGAIQ